MVVSIHAPVKSATGCSMPTESVIASFNPRAREERDDKTILLDLISKGVSIHAPVKSATLLLAKP